MKMYGAKEKRATDLEPGDLVLGIIYGDPGADHIETPWASPRLVENVQRVENDKGKREVIVQPSRGRDIPASPWTRVLVLTHTDPEEV